MMKFFSHSWEAAQYVNDLLEHLGQDLPSTTITYQAKYGAYCVHIATDTVSGDGGQTTSRSFDVC